MKHERVFSFPTSVKSVVKIDLSEFLAYPELAKSKSLYDLYERDFFYLPEPGQDIFADLRQRYPAFDEAGRAGLCQDVFGQFDAQIDAKDWALSEDEVIEFLWYRVKKEVDLLADPSLQGDYADYAGRDNARDICKFLLSQFALDYLTEASPLTRMLPGTFGDIQMAIFKIVYDEYGAGNDQHKHSVLFQGTLASLGMATDLAAYRPYILPSVYLYMSYVNRLTADKSLFFRFLGFLFVYEACLIYPTQQQGELLRAVFGPETDTRYFDWHVEIDQGHGVWCVEKALVPIIRRFGVDAAREILRGYHETNALLELCDLEMSQVIRDKRMPQAILK